jgi:hypothetical protein
MPACMADSPVREESFCALSEAAIKIPMETQYFIVLITV